MTGEVDLDTAAQLTAALEPHLQAGGDITLDLAGLRFMGSSGVQVLIRALQSLGGRGRLILANPAGSIRRLLDVMGLERFDNLEVKR